MDKLSLQLNHIDEYMGTEKGDNQYQFKMDRIWKDR